MSSGKLYIVPTPLGNLEDITLRALRILKEVDVIACEDTRHSLKLFNHFEIRKPLVSYQHFNEARRCAEFLDHFAQGKTMALVSDAGMPGISDPGARLVAACIEAAVPVEVLPGPSAVVTALAGAGLPTDRFYFGGFLPIKSAQRQNLFRKLADREETLVFYESPHRMESCLEDLEAVFPERRVVIARELSKIHEEYVRGTPAAIRAHFAAKAMRGEFVVLVGGIEAGAKRAVHLQS
ncbi:MAG: 16S rRNA (cytidine(1402)-2'-O)-methyltransferase [Verrucomicrobiae bacterium]|nr:16S rRNA (cytidine(1402)-2'-O)-methyltransferase [Verrucomicrobiae bacterium]